MKPSCQSRAQRAELLYVEEAGSTRSGMLHRECGTKNERDCWSHRGSQPGITNKALVGHWYCDKCVAVVAVRVRRMTVDCN